MAATRNAFLNWLPVTLGTIGLAYVSVSEEMRMIVNQLTPVGIKNIVLAHASYNQFLTAVFVISLLLLLIGNLYGSIYAARTDNKNKSLVAENNSLKKNNNEILIDCYALFSLFIKGYYTDLRMSSNERVSLYKADGEHFICIGRYSNDEYYRRRPDNIYPLLKGCIGRAWRQNICEEADAPDPKENLQDYVGYQARNYGYEEGSVGRMRMKSRAYFGVRLKNPNQESIAVLMFESTEPNGLKFSKLRSKIDVDEQRKLGALVSALESHIPSLCAASQEGF